MLLKKLAFATALTLAAFTLSAQAQEPRRGGTIRFTAPYGASFVSNDSHVSNQIQDEIYGYALHSMTLNEVTGVSPVSLVLRQAPAAVAVKPLPRLRW